MNNVNASDQIDEARPYEMLPPTRRGFLKLAVMTVLIPGATACRSLKSAKTNGPGPGMDLGQGDIGIMNYAYALEGLEAQFYTLVLQHPYSGMSSMEREILTDIRDHEIVHREFFRRALGNAAIHPLTYDFGKINFNSRQSVLSSAAMFEDLGVAAYNGAGKFVEGKQTLLMAGKIVSVEARHATVIRNLIGPGSVAAFDEGALDMSKSPPEVLKIADPFIVTKISGAHWKEVHQA